MVKPGPALVRQAGAAVVATALLGSLQAPASASVSGWWWGDDAGTGSITVSLDSPGPAGTVQDIYAWSQQPRGAIGRTTFLAAPETSFTWRDGFPEGAPGLPAGDYVIGANVQTPDSIYAPGYLTDDGWVPETGLSEWPEVTLADGEAKVLDVDVPIGGTATFRVVDPQGIPVPSDVTMIGLDGSTGRTATSNAVGEVMVPGLNTEQYSLTIDVNGAPHYLASHGNRLGTDADDVGGRGMVLGQETQLGTLVVENPFTDVWHSNQFAREILYMKTWRITTGYDDGSFRPLTSVNRDAMAAYMYRLAGSPAFTAPPRSPFVDVTRDDQFYKEISWLASTGITAGWGPEGAREFRPVQPVARDAMAAFIYRFVERFGELGDHPRLFLTPTTSPFADVSTGQQFYREMAWLRGSGVSTGWEDGTFRPLNSVNRDAMSAFIHRLDTTFLLA